LVFVATLTTHPGAALESCWSDGHPYTSDVEYGLLGPFRVLDDKGAEVQPSALKVRTLLALLVLNRGQPVSADRIADTLWGDEPPRSTPNLIHGYVRDLRRQLGLPGISTVTEVTASTSREGPLTRSGSRT
jgi:DNA-binding SARP family transcriptional activator